jgi:16S rRNA (uracil1498-N3)-methyltransferase
MFHTWQVYPEYVDLGYMKLQRFFVPLPIVSNNEPFNVPSAELTNQLNRVLRLHEGDEVVLFDNSGMQYRAAIYSYQNDSVSFTILGREEGDARPQRETWLFVAMVKKDNLEWIVQKATELGVSHIVPLLSARTEKKDFNRERLTKVSIEAAEQSGRATLPEIHDILKLADALSQFRYLKSVAWHPYATKFTHDDLADVQASYIGPEGGWTPEELQLFNDQGIKIYSLGPQVLRAETAVVAVFSQLMF